MLKPCRLVLVSLLLAASAAVQAWQVVDDYGTRVASPEAARRIVSVLPSLTEMVCELGACERLVGVDRYSDWPLSVRRLPKVGGGLDPNIEAIVALKPDVVLMSASSLRAAQQLRSLGLTVLALEPKQYADVERVYLLLAAVLGIPKSVPAKLWQSIDTRISGIAVSLPTSSTEARVYFEVSPAPYGAGESSFIGETLARLGAVNIISTALGAFPKLNPEFIVQADPSVIMASSESISASHIAARPGWQALQAVRTKRVCVFSREQSDLLVRPGPRMAEGAQLMADCLNNHLKGKP